MKLLKLIKEIETKIGKEGKEKRDGLFYIGSEEVRKIGFAVDPSLTAIKKAAKENIDLLVTHHHIHPSETKDIIKPDVLMNKKLEILAKNNISLASFHLMLDFSKIGNFESMAKELGFKFKEKIFEYETESGEKIKVLPFVILEKPLDIKDFTNKLESKGFHPKVHIFNNRPIKRIVIDTGAGGFPELLDGIYPHKPDLYITGEAKHQNFRDARDLDINIIFLGHYNSEKIGLTNLRRELESKYPELEYRFIEDENPY